jgi:hypothetical protein
VFAADDQKNRKRGQQSSFATRCLKRQNNADAFIRAAAHARLLDTSWTPQKIS